MEKMSHLFNQAVAPAKQQQTEKNKSLYVPEYARFKLQFLLRSGGSSIPYHSYDIHRGKGAVNITDEQTGYAKLITLVDGKRDLYIVATIWANLTDDLRTYINGKLNMNYDFIVFKHVRGQRPAVNEFLKFGGNGKLDVDLLRKAVTA